MKNISVIEFKNDIDSILYKAASGEDSISVSLENGLNAVIVDESEWNLMRDAFNMLVLKQRTACDG